MSTLDAIDTAIANLLVEDGRMTCAEIARRVSDGTAHPVSERAVRYRIERMIKRGILHVGAIVNPRALGYPVVADVMIEVEPGHVPEVARQMATYDCVSYAACSTGERDVSIQVVAHDNRELYDFVTNIVGNVPGVRKTTTYLVPFILKDVYQWRVPKEQLADVKGGQG
jgi:Lrp/AsnC family transcriptional regulator for asnA, asnC and gidA